MDEFFVKFFMMCCLCCRVLLRKLDWRSCEVLLHCNWTPYTPRKPHGFGLSCTKLRSAELSHARLWNKICVLWFFAESTATSIGEAWWTRACLPVILLFLVHAGERGFVVSQRKPQQTQKYKISTYGTQKLQKWQKALLICLWFSEFLSTAFY